MKPITIIQLVALGIQLILLVLTIINMRQGKRLSKLIQYQREYFSKRQQLLDEMQRFWDSENPLTEEELHELAKQIADLDERYDKIIGTQNPLIK